MTKVNGNDGNGKNNFDAIKAYLDAIKDKNADKTEKAQQAQGPKPTVPIGQTQEVQANALDATAAQIFGVHLVKNSSVGKLTPENVELTPEELEVSSNMSMDRNLMTLNEMTGLPNEALNKVALHQLRNDKDGFNVPINLDKLSAYLENSPLSEENDFMKQLDLV